MLLQRGHGSTLSGLLSFSLCPARSPAPAGGGVSGELLGSSASTTSGCGDGSEAFSGVSDSVQVLMLLPLSWNGTEELLSDQLLEFRISFA